MRPKKAALIRICHLVLITCGVYSYTRDPCAAMHCSIYGDAILELQQLIIKHFNSKTEDDFKE